MLTQIVITVLLQEREAWMDNNVLVHEVCRRYAKAFPNAPEPNYGSIIRIAAREKSKPRYRNQRQRLAV